MSSPGMVTKKVQASTMYVPSDKTAKNFKSILNIESFSLFEPLPGIDYSVLNQPLLNISYNAAKKSFSDDKAYTDQMLGALQRIKDDERALIKKYETAVAAADAAFTTQDWVKAKTNYEQSLTFLPNKQHPKDRLALIQKIIKEEEGLAKKAEADKLAAENAAKEKAAAEKAAKEKAEADKLAAEKAAAEKVAKEKAEADKLASEKAVAEKVAKEKAEADKLAAEKAAAEKAAKEKAEADKLANEKAAAEKAAKEKAEADKLAAEKAAKNKIENEKLAKEKAAADKLIVEKAAKDKLAAEKLAAEKAAKDKDEAERIAKEKLAAEKAAKKLAAEKAAADKDIAEQLAKEKAEADKLAKEKEEKELIKIKETEAAEKEANEKRGEAKHTIAAPLGKNLHKEAVTKADGYFKMKRYAEAKTAYEEALKIKPTDAYSTNKLADIEKIIGSK